MMSKKIKLISNGNVVGSKWFGLWQNLQFNLKVYFTSKNNRIRSYKVPRENSDSFNS
jgi:hypothetical protein